MTVYEAAQAILKEFCRMRAKKDSEMVTATSEALSTTLGIPLDLVKSAVSELSWNQSKPNPYSGTLMRLADDPSMLQLTPEGRDVCDSMKPGGLRDRPRRTQRRPARYRDGGPSRGIRRA